MPSQKARRAALVTLLSGVISGSATVGAAWLSRAPATDPDCVQVLSDLAGLYQRQPAAVIAWTPDQWPTADECGISSFVRVLGPLPTKIIQPTPHH